MRDKKAATIALVCYALFVLTALVIASNIDDPCADQYVFDLETRTCLPGD